jgi:broad specificity phosphatase PhoE
MDWGTIEREFPEHWARFQEDPAECPYLGGESYRDVCARVQPILLELLARHRGESIAIVAHNVVNRVYLAQLLGLELRLAQRLRQQNGCINLIGHTAAGTTVVTMNATFHLDEPPV